MKNSKNFIQVDIPVSALHNPGKYRGRNRLIQAKSSWEISLLKYLDSNPSVIGFSYEEIIVQYTSPLDKRQHNYFPDFHIQYYAIDKKIKESLIEVKPWFEIQHALTGKIEFKTPVPEKQQREVFETAMVNRAKFYAGMEYAKRNSMKFVLLSEKDILQSASRNFNPNL